MATSDYNDPSPGYQHPCQYGNFLGVCAISGRLEQPTDRLGCQKLAAVAISTGYWDETHLIVLPPISKTRIAMKSTSENSLPRAKKSLVVKPESIRVLELGTPALRNLEQFSKRDCPEPNAS